jgi:hypothetical protein
MKKQNFVEEKIKEEYFGNNDVSFEDVFRVMKVFEKALNDLKNMLPNLFDEIPLVWYKRLNRADQVSFSGESIGTAGVGINSTSDVFNYTDDELYEIAIHEFGHEIDIQNDFTSLERNNSGYLQGDEKIIDYLFSDKVDYDFDGVVKKDANKQREIKQKLGESFADVFVKWFFSRSNFKRLISVDEDVLRYLDEVFGYLDWAKNYSINTNKTEKSRIDLMSINRHLKSYVSSRKNDFIDNKILNNNVVFSFRENDLNSNDRTLVISSDNYDVLRLIEEKFKQEIIDELSQYNINRIDFSNTEEKNILLNVDDYLKDEINILNVFYSIEDILKQKMIDNSIKGNELSVSYRLMGKEFIVYFYFSKRDEKNLRDFDSIIVPDIKIYLLKKLRGYSINIKTGFLIDLNYQVDESFRIIAKKRINIITKMAI